MAGCAEERLESQHAIVRSYHACKTYSLCLYLSFKRTNHFHGSSWPYEVDDEDFIVKETATGDPIDVTKKHQVTEFISQRVVYRGQQHLRIQPPPRSQLYRT